MFNRINKPGLKVTLKACHDRWDNSPYGWKYDDPAFEVVGDKLVSKSIMDYLLEYLDGKPILLGEVISISELLDKDFLGQFTGEEHAVMGDCIGKLIDTGRLVFSADM
jgi:hypothetical protein